MKKCLSIFLIVCCCGIRFTLPAQLPQLFSDPDTEFKYAKDLFQKEQFSLAYPVFKKLYSSPKVAQTNLSSLIRLECAYYYIICGLQLNDETTVPMAVRFIELENHPALIQMMQYHLGEYYFRRDDYAKAENRYAGANIANLSNREIATMKFHQAYGFFVMQQFDQAKPLFNVIRQIPSDPNYLDANYYYGFICFNDKQYQQALACFQLAEKLPEYQSVIPFYVAEIYYFKGEKEKALEYGTNAIQKSEQYYQLQLNQLVGHILFEKQAFAKALPYLERFVAGREKVKREDLYELAYCYYDAENWTKSIEGFKQLGGAEDSLAQNSMYLLADAYLKTGDKANARTAFQFCAANNSHALQQEVSSFNYGKLSYDLGYMDPALQALQAFISKYPNSRDIQEAKELLVNTFASTSNYKESLKLYESLRTKSDYVSKLYPRLLYGCAVEFINDQQIEKADELLSKVLQVPFNTTQVPLANFWKGEIAYRNGLIDESINYLGTYLKNPVTNGEVNSTHARYILGYGYLKQEQYTIAKNNFELIAKSVYRGSTAIEQDAFLRSADCYFMNKEYKQSLKMYEQVINLQLASADYALYQKGIIAGALTKNADKISLLQSLERLYPASSLVPDAYLEVANTYLSDENYQAALAPLQKVINHPKAVSLAPQSYLKLGVAYFNLDRNEESLESFKRLVINYPNTEESENAIDYIRNIFIEKQQPDAFALFMKQNGKTISNFEEDSLHFRSPMLRYEAKDWVAAKKGFTQYIAGFPDGKYQLEANYLLAEMYTTDKALQAALPFYKAVADQAQNKYAERSTLQVARIYYFELKDYPNAEKYFGQLKVIAALQENKLEAMRGLLRCQFKTQQWKEAATNAQDLLLEKGIAADDRMMANMVLAKNYQLRNEIELALPAYKLVIAAGKSEYAAESQYRVAEIVFLQDNMVDAEKAAFEVIKKFGSYDFWVTKSYVLLGDIYVKQKDWFNAEATFKSIVANATIVEFKNEAQQKLTLVLEEKNKSAQIEQL